MMPESTFNRIPESPNRLAAALFLLTFCWAVAADSEHPRLSENDALGLSALVDAAWARHPHTSALPSRDRQAEAWQNRGTRLLSDRPSIYLRWHTDRLQDDAGLDEYEAGVLMPLWRWGGRAATQAVGEAHGVSAVAAKRELRWKISGEVRRAYWRLAVANARLQSAIRAKEYASRLLKSVQRRHELGDTSQMDVLLSRSAELDAHNLIIEREAALVDAEREYHVLTGLSERPPIAPEILNSVDEVAEDHPALDLLDSEIARAEAEVLIARKASGRQPELLFGPRRERAAFSEQEDDSLGLTLTYPFGGSSHIETLVAEAERKAAELRAARAAAVRQLNLDLHEARHALKVTAEKLTTATTLAELARQQRTMGEIAYSSGEMDLMDFLRLQKAAEIATLRVDELQMQHGSEIALYNQAVGSMP